MASASKISNDRSGRLTGGGPIRVIVVDDHPAVRHGLEALFSTTSDLDLVAAAADVGGALKAAERVEPDLVVVDYSLGSRDGLQLCRALKAFADPPLVLIFSAYADQYLALSAIVAGADGVLTKGVLGSELCDAVLAVARGETWLPPIGRDALEAAARRLDPNDVPILGTLVRGIQPADIADALQISEPWLESRRWAMLERLREPATARRRRRVLGRRSASDRVHGAVCERRPRGVEHPPA